MQSKLHLSTNPSAARPVGNEAGNGSREAPAIIAAPGTRLPSARIRELRELVERILLEEDSGELAMLGAVIETLNRVRLELNECEGLQVLYECWVQNAP